MTKVVRLFVSLAFSLFIFTPPHGYHYLVFVWIRICGSTFAFLSFFFFFLAACFEFLAVNSAPVHYSQVSQTSLFRHFFIKNGSHSTIHTFKNYFATVFSVFSFKKISFIQTDISLGLDCTKKEKNLCLAFFLWVLCIVHGTRKYRKMQSNF